MRYTPPPAPARPAVASCQPHYDLRVDDPQLPAWSPTPPAGRWTPSTAAEAARRYATDVVAEHDVTLDEARVARVAYRALRASDKALTRAHRLAVLAGTDPFRREFHSRDRRPEPVAVDDAPF